MDSMLSSSGTGMFHGRQNAPRLLSALTRRELRVLAHLESGATNKQISRTLCVTENTIKFHLKNIYAKLHVANRLQALIAARSFGITDLT
jgi:LuxR family maltose regulon positive regulatory protein